MRVVDLHVDAVLDEPAGPAAADHAAPDDGGFHVRAGRLELLARLRRPQHADVHRLEDRHCPLDELSVRRLDPALEPDVVLEPHTDVAADERRERDVRELHAADREGGEDAACRGAG